MKATLSSTRSGLSRLPLSMVLVAVFTVAGGAVFEGRVAAQSFDFNDTDTFDPEEQKEIILELIRSQVLEEKSGPSVLAGIDPRNASASVRKVVRVVKSTKVDLVVERQSVKDTVRILRAVSGLNFVISAKARKALEKEDPQVTLNLQNLSLENVLNLMAIRLGDYRFTVRYGAVVLVRQEEYRPRRIRRIYTIRDLVRKPPDFPAPKLGLEDLNAR